MSAVEIEGTAIEPVSAGVASEAAAAIDARTRILHEAERLFAEHGYAATSVQEIADAAAVNKALVYYYFRDKQDLYTSLLADGHAASTAVVERAVHSAGSPQDRLRRYIRDHCAMLWDRPAMLRLMHREIVANDGPDERMRDTFGRNTRMLAGLIGEGVATGAFRPVKPEFAVRALVGTINMFVTGCAYMGEQIDRESVTSFIADLYLRGLASDDEPER
jgi:AcrR family transcriptional regulator